MTKERRMKRLIESAKRYALRSSCWVRAGAVIVGRKGTIVSAGWNHAGLSGYGQHAEAEAIARLPPHTKGVKIIVAKWNGRKWLTSYPCRGCSALIVARSIPTICYYDGKGWRENGEACIKL